MYNIALDISQADPARCVYIDDRVLFVEIAQGMGIHGIHHTYVESTRKRVKELGLEASWCWCLTIAGAGRGRLGRPSFYLDLGEYQPPGQAKSLSITHLA